jgi:hypothetical protein
MKMKKTIMKIILCFVTITVVFSCKKKETAPTPATTNSASGYYGVLSTIHFNVLQGGVLTNYQYQGLTNVSFSSQPMINNGVVNNSSVDAGNVSINSVLLKKMNATSLLYYNDTTNTLHTTPNLWIVSGSSSIPAFTFTNTNSYPTYSGYSSLKDTIKLGQSNSINLFGINGANQIEVYLSDYPQSHISTLKYVSGTNTSITFSPSEMNALTATTSGFLTVICYKDTIQSFGGKDYKFQMAYQLQKMNMVFN